MTRLVHVGDMPASTRQPEPRRRNMLAEGWRMWGELPTPLMAVISLALCLSLIMGACAQSWHDHREREGRVLIAQSDLDRILTERAAGCPPPVPA